MMNEVDYFIIADDVQFIKGGWINRNRILVDDEVEIITLPCKKASSRTMINQRFFVNENDKGKIKMCNKIYHAYHKAPYFDVCFEMIQKTLEYNNNNVACFIKNSLKEICAYLNINTRLFFSSEFKKPLGLNAQDAIIYICKKNNADCYVNAIGGLGLYSHKKFEENGLMLKFIKTRESLKYRQFNDSFVANLSIIDVMMFNSVTEIRSILSEYEWIRAKN